MKECVKTQPEMKRKASLNDVRVQCSFNLISNLKKTKKKGAFGVVETDPCQKKKTD